MKRVMPPSTYHGRSAVRGLTLLELFIAVALLAILCAIAISAYQRYILRAQIAKAKVEIAVMTGLITAACQDGVGYPQTRAAIHLATRIDPWGRPYEYYDILANGNFIGVAADF